MAIYRKFKELISLNQAFINWEGMSPLWKPRTFGEYCDYLKEFGWRII